MIAMRRTRGQAGTAYEPTAGDIRKACEQIQATWSARERIRRYRGPRAAWWMPPTIRLSGLLEAVHEDWADGLPYCGMSSNEAER